jgi:hypothetical protein
MDLYRHRKICLNHKQHKIFLKNKKIKWTLKENLILHKLKIYSNF